MDMLWTSESYGQTAPTHSMFGWCPSYPETLEANLSCLCSDVLWNGAAPCCALNLRQMTRESTPAMRCSIGVVMKQPKTPNGNCCGEFHKLCPLATEKLVVELFFISRPLPRRAKKSHLRVWLRISVGLSMLFGLILESQFWGCLAHFLQAIKMSGQLWLIDHLI